MSASGKRLLAACIFALCSIPVLIVYADYSEPPQVDFSFWNLGVDVYRIKIRSSDLNSYTELYYSPLGKTKALKERTWFPPVELAPAWFV